MAFNIDNGLTLSVIQHHGHEIAEEIQFRVLRSHQKHLFLGGLKKLGLDGDMSGRGAPAQSFMYCRIIWAGFVFVTPKKHPAKLGWCMTRLIGLTALGHPACLAP